jgi:hypothetical protein
VHTVVQTQAFAKAAAAAGMSKDEIEVLTRRQSDRWRRNRRHRRLS